MGKNKSESVYIISDIFLSKLWTKVYIHVIIKE